MDTNSFFKFANFVQGYSAQPKFSPFFAGNPDFFGSSLFPLSFFSFLYFGLSHLSLTFSIIFLSSYLRYISYYLCTGSLWPFCCLYFSLSDSYTFELKLSKKCSVMRFCRASCHVHEVTSSWGTDVMSAHYLLFFISSATSFFKKNIMVSEHLTCTDFATSPCSLMVYLISLLHELVSDSDTPPSMPHRRGRFCRSPSPRWGASEDPSSLDCNYTMAWPEWNCLSPPPPTNCFLSLPIMKCPISLPLTWITWSPSH